MAVLSAALLLEYLGRTEESRRVESAVVSCIRTGRTPKELGGELGTREVGDAVVGEILAPSPAA